MPKKTRKQETRQKEFTPAPFKALRGFQPEPSPPANKPQEKKPAERVEEMRDADLFLAEMASVKPLPGRNRPGTSVQKQVKEAETRVSAEERKVFMEALGKLQLDITFSDAIPQEQAGGKPMPANRMRQLKRGEIRVDLELDLHGLTREEALQSLHSFVTGAYNRKQKAVLVITGKGNNSEGEPVLLRAVAGWLRDKGREMVAEFASAPREMGGAGAFVLFLKGKKEVPEKT